MTKEISRRQFIGSAITTAAIASLPANRLFAGQAQAVPESSSQPKTTPAFGQNVAWKDQGFRILPNLRTRSCEIFRCTP